METIRAREPESERQPTVDLFSYPFAAATGAQRWLQAKYVAQHMSSLDTSYARIC
jgi:hypothetical protein